MFGLSNKFAHHIKGCVRCGDHMPGVNMSDGGCARVQGMGELHLDIIVDRLRREYKVECDVGAPQVNSGPRPW